MAYEYSENDVWNFANTTHVEKRKKGDELFFKYCPYCNGGDHKDKDTFSINLKTGTFKCFRATCGKQGHFVELARDFGFELNMAQNQKQYRKLKQQKVITTDAAEGYLAGRGISAEIARRYKITTHRENQNILVFPFYDQTGTFVFVKYRNTKYNGKGSKEWSEKNTKPILFGMVQCTDFDRLIITEGQIDSLSVAECGIKNAVSVPNGALGFTWVSNVWDWIIQFQEIVVFGDYENEQVTLLEELQKRLPNRIKVVQPEDYLGEKDANAILTKYGKNAVIHAVENAKVPPVKHVKELADVRAVDLNKLPKIKTNIAEVDKIIGGLYFGQVVLLTGKRGEGKSTFMSQLAVEAIEQDYPVFVYSGELTDYHFKSWIDFQAAGPQNIMTEKNEYGDEIYSLKKETVDKINDWYRGKAYIYDNNCVEDDELESLTETIENTIRQYGIKLVCVDNLMTALDVDLKDDLYRAQSKFVKQLKTIAVKYDVVVVLVAHPRKSKDRFVNDDVMGSGDITNRVDIVMSYSRNDNPASECDSKLAITKNRLTGRITRKDQEIMLYYSGATKRIKSVSTPERMYGWERDVEIEGFTQVQDLDLPF